MEDISACYFHPARPAGWFCSECGRFFCEECVTLKNGNYYCEECLDTNTVNNNYSEVDAQRPVWPDKTREADFVKRLIAFQLDFIIFLSISILLAFLLGLVFSLSYPLRQRLFFIFLYAGILVRDILLPGGSPGKRLMSLYVWDIQEDKTLTLWQSVLRNLFLPVFYFDMLTVFLTEHQQRVGDLLAGTFVCDQETRTDDRKNIYNAAALTAVVLLGLLIIFINWFSVTATRRMTLYEVLSQKQESENGLEARLERAGHEATRLRVEKNKNMVTIIGEFSGPDSYYRGRRQINSVLAGNSYEILQEEGPLLVSRGPDTRHFQLTIKAQYKQGGEQDGSL